MGSARADSILGGSAGLEVSVNGNLFYSARVGETGEDEIMSGKLDGNGNPLMEVLYCPGVNAYPSTTGYDPVYKRFFVIGTGWDADGDSAALTARY